MCVTVRRRLLGGGVQAEVNPDVKQPSKDRAQDAV